MKHHCNQLIDIFNQTFKAEFNTELVLGTDEPIYLPACKNYPSHRIIFAHGFFASALHEVAHWCIAGEQRRLLEDYGYWYHPDGRDEITQASFEKVEIKPQAIEWILSASCKFSFQVSCDNLNGHIEPDRHAFLQKVQQQVFDYLANGMPVNAQLFSNALRLFYAKSDLSTQDFQIS